MASASRLAGPSSEAGSGAGAGTSGATTGAGAALYDTRDTRVRGGGCTASGVCTSHTRDRALMPVGESADCRAAGALSFSMRARSAARAATYWRSASSSAACSAFLRAAASARRCTTCASKSATSLRRRASASTFCASDGPATRSAWMAAPRGRAEGREPSGAEVMPLPVESPNTLLCKCMGTGTRPPAGRLAAALWSGTPMSCWVNCTCRAGTAVVAAPPRCSAADGRRVTGAGGGGDAPWLRSQDSSWAFCARLAACLAATWAFRSATYARRASSLAAASSCDGRLPCRLASDDRKTPPGWPPPGGAPNGAGGGAATSGSSSANGGAELRDTRRRRGDASLW